MLKKTEKTLKLIQNEEIYQAVVIADNFSQAFAPISNDVPIALLPLANTPLIDYTLECLSLAGIKEVFLFCCSHVDKIRSYINFRIDNNVGWSITINVKIIVLESCRSLGDALRDLDAKGIIRGDFVLLGADTVANIKLLPILKKHKATCKKDKGAAMTLIYKQMYPGQRGRCPYENLILVSDKGSHKVLFHQKPGLTNLSKIDLPLETVLNHSEIEIRHDLQDTHISICSPSVLPLFSDNFDFQTRDDFIKGLLMNEEIMGSTLYWYQADQYASKVSNWRMYQAISHDVIHRWVFPLVVDMGVCDRHQLYMYLRNNIYRNKNVKLEKGSNLQEDVVIADGCTVAENTTITRSVIGKNCHIGHHVEINDSYILPGTTIGNNCIISFSVIGSNCRINDDVKLSRSSILGQSVVINKGLKIQDLRLQSTKPINVAEKDILGEHAHIIHSLNDEWDESNSDQDETFLEAPPLYFGSQTSFTKSDSDLSSASEDEMSHMASPVPEDESDMYFSEVIDILARGFDDKLACSNLIVEINTSRSLNNVTLREVNYNVVKAILSLPFHQRKENAYLQSLLAVLKYFTPVVKNYIKNDEAVSDCLQAIGDVACASPELLNCLRRVFHWFYDIEILSEDAILEWYPNLNNPRLSDVIKPFILWLEEADEESDSD